MITKVTSRNNKIAPVDLLTQKFEGKINLGDFADAVFSDPTFKNVIGIANLPMKAPVMQVLLENCIVLEYVKQFIPNQSVCFVNEGQQFCIVLEDGKKIEVPQDIDKAIRATVSDVAHWAGYLTEEGEHVIDLLKPAPGPHFYVNLLLGNRLGFNRTLQTTPKSVVDRFGRGSFRSHAATQVLATRFDVRQDENGFPANRQFYLYEDGKQIFYSALIDDNIVEATCKHSCNRTVIKYKTACKLEITRTIFLVPHKKGFPLATELQRIEVKNASDKARNLAITYTGMFGTGATHAIFEDVTYTNVIMQSAALYNDKGEFIGITPDYYPEEFKQDTRFVSMIVRNGEEQSFPQSFCTDYNDFIGKGTLEHPSGGYNLNNKLNRKGPGFFALGSPLTVEAGETVIIDTFTGLSSSKDNANYSDATMCNELDNLLCYFEKGEAVKATLDEIINFQENYCKYFEFQTGDKLFDSGFNKNLSFQVLYQTFMSRSFCQTQKGYREIGFREIQDLFASMYYFINIGYQEFVKNLLYEWTANVYKMGYANHNFYWVGKQPGLYSDDSLWLLQAYYRYIVYTKDTSVLNEEVAVADGNNEKRVVRDTLQAIIQYSACISIGDHGLPLLDHADWNDCLKIDNNYIDGATKEKLYYEQLKKTNGKYGDRFVSDHSESVMNAFLLKLAIDHLAEIASLDQDIQLAQKMSELSEVITSRIQEHAWKDNFFARVLLNRYKDGSYTYLGAIGDKLSDDPNIDGVYFLNSFSWSILSEVATDEQIGIMVDTIKKYLLTKYGLRLISPADLNKLAHDTATGHYFFGDRENGAVFKHASMMAAAALAKAAKKVKDNELAKEMTQIAYFMVDLVLPYKNLENPFQVAGNPRICTQYINAETGENIGPLLSGTATWLNLTLISLAGIDYTKDGISFSPILREEDTQLNFVVKAPKCSYKFSITKPVGFIRMESSEYELLVDGKKVDSSIIPLYTDEKEHTVTLQFK
ncbi:GH36-type glycosyl hydrolase domain-containing protein [Acetivibrio mesophilus]|uniref:Glycosyl transferase n=1 Tax=Acetivibrio mesophilus TaxID=2487273 RepID=A0A4Q0I3W6_9FIRM|nr:glycosyl transferase [Acetivibrio mesophilus]RXE58974.1 glycosyl transferase [Acetivibrio mesophilus]